MDDGKLGVDVEHLYFKSILLIILTRIASSVLRRPADEEFVKK